MFLDSPQDPNRLLFVCDVRLLRDRRLEAKQGGSPVLNEWPFGVACLGKEQWARTTKLALYDYGEKITKAVKDARRLEFLQFLELHGRQFKCIAAMQSRSSEIKVKEDHGDAQGLVGTHCWATLKAPDRIPDMAGCVWHSKWGRIIGILNTVNYEYVYRELIRRHIRLSLELCSRDIELRPKAISFSRDNTADAMLLRLAVRSEQGHPIAVDIESNSELDLITAIGFSDGIEAVSVPFEAYTIFNTNGEVEPAAKQLTLDRIRKLLNGCGSKLFHNYTYDVPFLRRKGFEMKGPLHDTMAMHVVVYKQWPHGLQRACAQELAVPPWKSLHVPQYAKRLKLTKNDVEWWTGDPLELRRYNCLDAFYTWNLGRSLAPKVGISL